MYYSVAITFGLIKYLNIVFAPLYVSNQNTNTRMTGNADLKGSYYALLQSLDFVLGCTRTCSEGDSFAIMKAILCSLLVNYGSVY